MWVYLQYYTILTILYRKCMYRQHTDALKSSALLRETAGINCPHWPWRWRCLHPWLLWCVSASRSSPGLPGNQTWRGTAAHTLQPQHSCITGRKQPASTGTQLNSISRHSSRYWPGTCVWTWIRTGFMGLLQVTPAWIWFSLSHS